MALTPARKTYPQLTAATDVQDSDLLATYRSPGPLKKLTAITYARYVSDALNGGAFVNVSAYGALPSATAATNTDAMREACLDLEAAGGGVLYVPPGEYQWGKQTLAGATGLGYSYQGKSAIKISNCTKPVVVLMAGVKMKVANGLRYGAFNPVTGAPVVTTPGTINPDQAARVETALEFIDNASVAVLGYPELDGNVQNIIKGGTFTIDPGDLTGIQLDYSGLRAYGNDSLYAEIDRTDYFGLDGVIIGWPGLTEADEIKPHVLNLRSSQYNGRQGISWVGGNHLTVNDANLSHTGKNGVVSSNPGAGFDIEAESSICRNLTLNNPYIYDNTGVGIVDSTGDNAAVTINGGVIIGTTNYSVWNQKPRWRINDTLVVGACAYVYGNDDPGEATQVRGGVWSMDVADSPSGVIFGAGSDRMELNWSGSTGACFDGVAFTASAAYGVPLSSISYPIKFINCTFDQAGSVAVNLQGIFIGRTTLNHVGATTNFDASIFNGPIFVNDVEIASTPALLSALKIIGNNSVTEFESRIASYFSPTAWGTSVGGGVRGDVVINSNASQGQPSFWICVTSGNPGTWVTGGVANLSQGSAQANSTAVTVADLVTDFNALLANLRAAGIIAI